MCVYIQACVYAYIYVLCMYVCMYVCMCVCVCNGVIHTNINIYIYILYVCIHDFNSHMRFLHMLFDACADGCICV